MKVAKFFLHTHIFLHSQIKSQRFHHHKRIYDKFKKGKNTHQTKERLKIKLAQHVTRNITERIIKDRIAIDIKHTLKQAKVLTETQVGLKKQKRCTIVGYPEWFYKSAAKQSKNNGYFLINISVEWKNREEEKIKKMKQKEFEKT